MPANKTTVDLMGGTVGGALQAVVGHPLDTIKVRLQNNQTAGQGGLRDVVRSMVREEGMLSLYKGVQAPFFLNGALNAVLFGVNSVSKDIVVAATGRRSHADLGLHHVIVSALLTAPVYCAAVVPVELVKCRLQAQKGGHGSAEASAVLKYKGPLHCATQTVAEEGLAGLWRGYAATVGMRMIGLPAYFAGYEGAKRALMSGQAGQHGGGNAATTQAQPPPPPPVSTAMDPAARGARRVGAAWRRPSRRPGLCWRRLGGCSPFTTASSLASSVQPRRTQRSLWGSSGRGRRSQRTTG